MKFEICPLAIVYIGKVIHRSIFKEDREARPLCRVVDSPNFSSCHSSTTERILLAPGLRMTKMAAKLETFNFDDSSTQPHVNPQSGAS